MKLGVTRSWASPASTVVVAAAFAFILPVVGGDVESTLARCCALGANWARDDKTCAEFPTPVTGEPSEHQSICLTAAAICCLRLYREEQCEKGKQAAQKGHDCRVPAALGGEYYKDCCEGCKLGLVSGSMALSCSFRSLQFGFPWDVAYTQCCTQLHPQLPVLPREQPERVHDNTLLYPGSSSPVADSDNLCLLFRDQLCAHICVPAVGSYTCQCHPGFTLSVDKKTCLQQEPIDRCADNDACEHICRDTGIAIVCACDPGYRLADDERSCDDINECEERADDCSASSQTCINSVGSYRCIDRSPTCSFGYRFDSESRECVDIDECIEERDFCDVITEVCTNLPGGYRCDQQKGGIPFAPEDSSPDRKLVTFSKNESLNPNSNPNLTMIDQTAFNIDFSDDALNSSHRVPIKIPSLRVPSALPTRSPHPDLIEATTLEPAQSPSLSYTNPISTTPPPLPSSSSSPSTASTNTPSASCPPGFHFDVTNDTCRDVDECETSPCMAEERCRNTLGSFECRCREGYKLDSSTSRCKDINECQLGTYDCEESQRCDNTIGSYTCVRISGCGTGYTLNHNNGLCEDIDECAESGLSNCRANENCVNLLGSYICQPKMLCGRGFALDETGTNCVDIDECASGDHECTGGQECHNRRGSYTCQCPTGFRLNRARQCQDIDECSTYYGAACSSNAVCENTPGSFLCHCNDGFEKTDGGRNCIDIDECAREVNICHHRCINIRGGYQCICNAGYNIAADNRTCVDVDECEETRLRGKGRLCVGVCDNTPGSFQCTCPPGYSLQPDLRTCKDNNECEREGVCRGPSEQCINTRGSFRCMEIACPSGYVRDTTHKSRCKKRSLYCRQDDILCHRQPLSYSYNFLPLVSNMSLPTTGQVDLFTMRGPLWATSTVRFALELESVRSPTGIQPAVRDSFTLRRTSINQAVISLQQQLEGPQEIQLALSMKLYHGSEYSGSAVAKLLILISEYDF